jgi:hypothetical protein
MVPLSQRLLTELREYWQAARPTVWLFPGADAERPLDPASVQNYCSCVLQFPFPLWEVAMIATPFMAIPPNDG